MKLFFRVFFLCLFASSTISVSHAQDNESAGNYTVIKETVISDVLSESRNVVVQLPKSYAANPSKKFPIIYRLDGAGNLVMMNAVLESLQSQGAAPEVIIVAIENTERLRDLYPTVNTDPNGPVGYGGGGEKFLSFITNELMPMIEGKYRVHDFRIIAGASAAGVFSLYALQKQPALFDAALSYSAAVWWAYGATGKSTVEFLKNTPKLHHYIYTAIGNEGAPMRAFYDEMIDGIKTHQPEGLRWVNDSFSNVPHNLVSTAARFRAYHNLFYPEVMPVQHFDGTVESIEAYYQEVSAQRGQSMEAQEWVIRNLGYHFVNQGELARAITLFKYGVKRYPDVPDAHNGLAYGYEQAGQLEDALIKVNKAIALANDEYQGYQVYLDRRERLLALLSKES